ncbi:tetratricopeptide repeat protein, partial [bacterium]|nr:tetratricopeptide repeat protein [bacterium]
AELRPHAGFILDSLGCVYFKMYRYEEAVSHLERSLHIVEDDPTVMEHLADAYAARHEYRNALKLYKKILDADPGRKDILEKKRKVRAESLEK